MVRTRTLAPHALLLLTVCAPAGDVSEHVEPADAPVCLAAASFVADGTIAVRAAEPADARQVGALRMQPYDQCDRVVIDLATSDGSNAERAGSVSADMLRELGVVRVTLHDVENANQDATDAAFGGSLAGAAYVVRSPDGPWTYVDVHLSGAAEASVTTLETPARVVIDLRPGGARVPPPAPRSNLIVVLQPRAGQASYPLTVRGYARTFEANVVVRLERAGEDMAEEFTTSTGWIDAWGDYAFEIADGPIGSITLHVGEYSARDGAWQGVAIALEMR